MSMTLYSTSALHDVGLGIKLKSMSVRSWRWTYLRLPQNPHIAARVLLKRAYLSFDLSVSWQMHIAQWVIQLFFLPVFCWLWCILVPSLVAKTRDWMKISQRQSLFGCTYPFLFHVVGRSLLGTSQNKTVR